VNQHAPAPAGVRLPPTATGAAPVSRADAAPLLRRFWSDHVYQHRGMVALALVAIGFVAASTSLYPLIINWAFDSFAAKDPWAIQTLPWLILLAACLKSAALYAQVATTQGFVTDIEAAMQRRLYAHLLGADLAQIGAQTPAAWTQRFTTDLAYVRAAMSRATGTLIRDGLTIVFLFATMVYLDWVLSLIAGVILPLALIPVTRIGRRLRRVARKSQEQTGGMASLTSESFSAARVVKTYRLEPYLAARADGTFRTLRNLRLRAALARGRMEPVVEVLGAVAVTVILIVIGQRIIGGESTIGEFTGFLGALLLASQPIRALGNLSATVQEGLAALKRYYAVLDEPAEVRDRPGAVDATFGAGAVRFEDVTFGYGKGAPALHSVTFEAPAGETTAIVGRSGAGKSTVFNLVARLYDVDSGRVLIGGEDVAGVTLSSLRDRIAVVSQEVVLFNDTVRANIALGRHGASEEAIADAARLASAEEFILRHPLGYDAPVGDRGANFSGGERQRIALARAFLKDAPVLLLDEATSALDAESEAKVKEALARLSTGRTTLVIAHRLSTVRAAAKIVVLDAGRVAEEGTHAELVAAGGLYAKFHRLQLSED
jgi:subfamily B ATP-binding cassette protein MsbA